MKAARNTNKKTEIKHPSIVVPLFSIFTCVALVGIHYFVPLPTPTTPLSQLYKQLAQNPASILAHTQLADYFFDIRNFEASKKELTLASQQTNSSKNTEVLGLVSDIDQISQKIDTYEDKKRQAYEYWEKIVSQNPKYVDGWIQLIFTAKSYNDEMKLQEYLKKMKEVDPLETVEINIE